MEENTRIARYQASYLEDYGFEAVMVGARQRLVLDMLAKKPRTVIVEAGCGANLLFNKAVDSSIEFERWIIVEPAPKFFEIAAREAACNSRLQVLHRAFEEAVSEVLSLCGASAGADVVLCSGLIHEVEDPRLLLVAAKKILAPSGVLHVNVPNVTSFHRRLAVAMGLIDSLQEPSERNRALSQHHFFDERALRALVVEAGFSIAEFGGYLIKPFTHRQMEAIYSVVDQGVLDGLWTMGRDLPELASEIFVNAGLSA